MSYERYKSFTMVDQRTFTANLELAEFVRDVQGAVVECGVWRGGMIAGIAAKLNQFRRFVLFDSFAGLPPAKPIDGPAALAWQADTLSPKFFNNCRAPFYAAEQAMRMAGAARYEVCPGEFEQTLPKFSGEIALLRLDADWHEATLFCLGQLFDRVVKGGLIVVDDYYVWDGCSRAVHEFLSKRQATERIRERDGVAYMIKN